MTSKGDPLTTSDLGPLIVLVVVFAVLACASWRNSCWPNDEVRYVSVCGGSGSSGKNAKMAYSGASVTDQAAKAGSRERAMLMSTV
eukprot:COSAG01_NODE_11145_length_1997_cov_2.231823_3_plen_86_part_00